jgi:rSAM/selenodomain-associated transferase 2
MRLAIVMPVLNEEAVLDAALARLASLRERGALVVVADGGSSDGSVMLAERHADRVLATPRGRGQQMNTGAAAALADPSIDVLVFLHADTQLPPDADGAIERVCRTALAWGRFDVRIDSDVALLRLVAALMNVRSRWTGISTGDQAIFATRALFQRSGGFDPLPLMEDIAFCRRARQLARPIALRERVTMSARRWQRHGVLRTVLLMWWLRLAYFLGADPARLAAAYRDAR